MPPKSRQPPISLRRVSGSSNSQGDSNSLRRVSGTSNPQSDHTGSESADGLDLKTDLENFINEPVGKRSPQGHKKKIKRLMKKISSKLPEGSPGLSRSDRDLCLAAIHVYIQKHNPKALEFFSLIEKESFAELLLRACCFSRIVSKDMFMNPETLKIHDRCDAGMFLSQLRSITTIPPLNLPAPEEYNAMKRLMDTFNAAFDQTSEQSAVIKVAAYKVLVHLQNQHLCTKYFPEFSLFTINQKESAAEVVARVNMNDYRYFLTGRADGFIVSLTVARGTSWSILAGARVEKAFSNSCDGLVAPKYRTLDSRLRDLTGNLSGDEGSRLRVSYEIVILEVKKLQLPAKIRGDELKTYLQQVIAECAAIHECGPNSSKFLKFILSDGDHWLFGVLRNPEINKVGSETRRECFYATLDNGSRDLSLIEQITELLAFWMAIPGKMLYECFFGMREEVAIESGASR